MFAGFNWGNAFGLGHLMTMQVTTDLEIKYSKAISGSYTMDLPRNHSLSFSGAYSEIVGVPNGGFNQEGTSWQTGLNYSIPLPEKGAYTHSLELGLDYKSSDNNLELSLPPFIIPISDNLTHVAQGRIQYRGTLKDRWGATTWAAKATYSPGGLNTHNDDEAFQGTRAFASAEYAYFNLDGSRSVALGTLWDAMTGWNWSVRASYQYSNRNLLGSEQFSAGGSGSVRGYSEGEVVGDNGFLISQELSPPAISTKVSLPGVQKTGMLQGFVFQDYAKLWNTDQLIGENAFFLHSVGVGFRYQVEQNFTLNVSHGWQLRDSGSSSTGDNRRAHVSLQFSY